MLYYTVYRVRGLNLDRLIGTLKKRGINLYDVKKKGQKTLILTVNGSDNEKFFAISQKLCYNIKRLGEKGKHYPLFLLIKNLGATIGAVLFALSFLFINDLVFSFEFTGTGSVYKKEVENYLNGRGIVKFSRFSDLDLDALSDEILASSDKFSFAEAKKRGNRLIISLAEKKPNASTLTGTAKNLISTLNGVVEEVKVYRGTALVKQGDVIKDGDLLVDGYLTVKDVRVETNVIATVTVRTDWVFTYISDAINEEKFALALAEGVYGFDYDDCSVSVKKSGEKYEYTVILQRLNVLFAG